MSEQDAPYLLPPMPTEIDRLDLQHYAIRQHLGGSNFLAPVCRPIRILDAGAGTGQWGWDLCERFPDAQVIGIDLQPGKPDAPERYHFRRVNVLEGLPFEDESFDLVHQRFLFAGVPLAAWRPLVSELTRVTARDGWVELVEPDLAYRPEGPANVELQRLYRHVAQARGMDSAGLIYESLDERLRAAGLVDVERREISLPVGEWAGRVGSLMCTDLRNSARTFLAALQRGGAVTPERAHDLVLRLQAEFEDLQVTMQVAIAYGRKPA